MKYDFIELGVLRSELSGILQSGQGQYASGFQMTIAFLTREWRFIAMLRSISSQDTCLAPTVNTLFINPQEFTLCVLDM
jgi:hypothetical protein